MIPQSLLILSFLPLAWTSPALAEEAKIRAPLLQQADPKPRHAHVPAGELPVAPARRAPPIGARGPAGTALDLGAARVHWDAEADASIWALGHTYKASFDAHGATYVPFLGSRAPRNFPVGLQISAIEVDGRALEFDAAVAPQRSGDRVVYDRGLVLEIYDLRPDSMEQSFVFEDARFGGELLVRLALDTQLARSNDTEGLVLSNELGAVRYSSAVTIDGRGTRRAAPTAWNGGAIELRVPASTLAEAQGALTIDPVLSTYSIDMDPADDFAPDVAWDQTSQRQMVVYERVFSATDHDVYFKLLDVNGNASGFEGAIDSSTTNWAHPRVASNGVANNFLCVAQAGPASGGARIIRGRLASNTGVLGTKFTIDDTSFGDLVNPVVGGDSVNAAPTFFYVVYERIYSANDHDIFGRLIAEDGTLQGAGPELIDNTGGTYDQEPVISKTDGAAPFDTQEWTIVWNRTIGLFGFDLYGARIHWNGSVTTASFPIDTSSDLTYLPSVSSLTDAEPRRCLLTYARAASLGSDTQIVGRLMSGSTTVDTEDLTALMGGASAELQFQSSVDSDGRDFLLAWTEQSGNPGNDLDIHAATIVQTGTHLAVAGTFGPVFATTREEDQVSVCATRSGSGTARRALVVCRLESTATNRNIYGALLSSSPFTRFCSPGVGPTMNCPCGNPNAGPLQGCNNSSLSGGAILDAAGDPDADTVYVSGDGMRPNATCIFLQGAAANPAGASFGDGVRCASGQLLRLAVKTTSPSSISSFPQAGDPSIKTRCATLGAPISSGEKRVYQVYYRDPQSYGCGGAATFNITAAVQVQW